MIAVEYVHLIVCQVERVGYQCLGPGGCHKLHRRGEPEFDRHLACAMEGLTFWTETRTFALNPETQQWVRLPAALGLAALERAEDAA